MAKVGCLDSVDDGILRGWALDEESHSPTAVDIYIGGGILDRIACSEFRPDLVAARGGTGWHGFTYPVPERYMRSRLSVSVKFAEGGSMLENGQRVLPDFTNRFLISAMLHSAVLSKGLWCIDRMCLSDSGLSLEGWCVPPRAIPVPVALTHDGEPLDDVVRFSRDDIAALLNLAHDEIGFGFRASGRRAPEARRHEFSFQHALTKQRFDPNQSIYYIFSEAALPADHLRVRVHGSTDVMGFVKEGSTAYAQIECFLERYCSKSMEDFGSILDWGCGCGRMLRYVPARALRKLTGIDIDAQGIEWCRQAFPEGRFLAIAAEPPTPFESESFDLIYANSVLTHLRQKDHLAWMSELFRLARPGATLMLTTAGERSWWGGRFPSSRFLQWQIDCAGFYEGGRNTNLADLGVGDYYRNVFISRDFIWRNWSALFEIVEFVPCGIGNLQDLTILRKRE
jgi:SAM-dependent methyltransferase